MISLLAGGDEALKAAASAAGQSFALSDVKLEAPVQRPGKVMAIGLNYADHVAETGRDLPPNQIWFTKAVTSIAGPTDAILNPSVSDMVDYEAELVVIIGKRARHIPKDRAHEVIAGLCIGNDVSVRDWQSRSPQFVIGKSFDSHAPIGPWITTLDEAGDPHDQTVKTWVNGDLRQDSNTEHLIFNCFDQIAELTSVMTLEPGDVIFTGTPSGVGAAMDPPQFLKDGDIVKIEIGNLGAIENPVIDEDKQTIIGN
ncbi:Fahd2 [Symbiodinium microadriaticum]|nr:Fahd2 [Symbiodinium microadriaticum]